MTGLVSHASRLDMATLEARAVPQSPPEDQLDVDTAYAVQALGIARRLARGEQIVGLKMGLTSRAKMEQVGVDEVVWGQLTDAMRREEGGALRRSDFIHPRAEPEIAFLLKRRLTGRVSLAEAVAALEAVAPAVEIIDSRYADFRFSLGDVIADNASSAAFSLGGWRAPDTDVRNLGIVVSIDGVVAQVGSSAAILGDPLRSLVAAAELTACRGMTLEPGMIVLAGGATAAVPLGAGNWVSAEFQSLGTVGFGVA